MNYHETLDYLYSLQKSGIKFGLENTKKLLYYFGNPHQKFKSIHIAGTNGKGSTSSLIASVLAKMNFKVGLYTSPHLVKFNERIRIDGYEITDDYLVETVNQLKELIEKIKPTFFEVTTAIAFNYFADNKVDYAVVETGLGGRLDSTNVIHPEISIITKVDYDHKEFLGDTIEQISYEKGGIIKPEVPVVIGSNNEIVKNILKKIALEKKSKIIFTDEMYTSEIIEKNLNYFSFLIKSKLKGYEYSIKSPLIGDYQVENFKNVIATFETLFSTKDLREEIALGSEEMKFPLKGRFQILKTKPVIVLDTSHNSDAIKNFLSSLNSLISNRKFAVFGIMKDKEIDEVIIHIEQTFEKIFVCQAKVERSLDVNLLEKKFSKSEIEKSSSVENAIEKALNHSKQNDVIVIFGSNYIVGEALEFLRKKNFI